MGTLIPFFYYDILSRIIPGACTIVALLLIKSQLPAPWLSFFARDTAWQAVVVPIVLGGVSYVIGVAYEVTDYSIAVRWAVNWGEGKAFDRAWRKFQKTSRTSGLPKLQSHDEKKDFRMRLWDKLAIKGGKEQEMGFVFAHCHRFQAEYKMFLHLTYPTILLAILAYVCRHSWLESFAIILGVPVLAYLANLRDERRWLQALAFGQQLDLLGADGLAIGEAQRRSGFE
ncbi:MAG: hypothetical protein L0387_40070 [Acidobacteria bacterium]|nr:hypothetical protein [Acidobacteriota bacterium]